MYRPPISVFAAVLAGMIALPALAAADAAKKAPLFETKKAAPEMSLRPGEGDGDPNAWPHTCYGDRHEKDEDLNAFYPITDEELSLLLGRGPGS